MEILAIIPARGGSKGLPNKNILPLIGHPLIAYSIKASQQSKLINRIIVSTDSEQIAKIAQQYGAEVPFMRPDEYAQDLSTDWEVFHHALCWLTENENYHPDLVVQLRPTAPARVVEIVDDCIEKMINTDADSLRTVIESPITPYKMWKIEDNNPYLQPLLTLNEIEEPYNQPRQILPKTYWHNAFLDVIKPDVILEQKSICGKKILPYILPNDFSVDIDDMDSFVKAEKVMKANEKYVHFD